MRQKLNFRKYWVPDIQQERDGWVMPTCYWFTARINKMNLDRYRKPYNKIDTNDRAGWLMRCLTELYSFYLEPEDRSKHDLIEKYYKVVSYRLIREYNALQAKGLEQGAARFQDLIYRENPFFKLLKNDSSWQGKYVPVPLQYEAKSEKQTEIRSESPSTGYRDCPNTSKRVEYMGAKRGPKSD